MPTFIKGLELNRLFYAEVVRPLLDKHFPKLPHAAAMLGPGSEVLGFDTAMSTDHDWGPGLTLFLEDADAKETLTELLSHHLPPTFRGYPTRFEKTSRDPGPLVTLDADAQPLHHVTVTTPEQFVQHHLNVPLGEPLGAAEWLTFPSQRLRGITGGAVYFDAVGDLTKLRDRFRWYPRDVWLYLLAAAWRRIEQEQPLMSRAGQAGDDLGSRLIAARLVRDIMRLCFLQEKQYAPYPKWYGTAFRQLACAPQLSPSLEAVMRAEAWQRREAALNKALEVVAHCQNELTLTAPVEVKIDSFFSRPFKVLKSNFVDALLLEIQDEEVKRLAQKPLIGNIDLVSDNTDLRANPRWQPALLKLYT